MSNTGGSTPRERVTVDAELLLDALHVVSCPFYECARCSEITARYENTGGEIGVLKALDDAVKVSRTSAVSETRGSDETGWLIENAERLYLTTDATGFFAWTKDNLDAIRFCRRQDAEKVASGNDDAWHVVEHMWSDPAPIEKMNVNTEKRGKP